MKRYNLQGYFVALMVTAGVLFASCGRADTEPKKMAVDSVSPKGPAPDNNSASNPSLADTAYESNRTRPITDTMRKDSGR